MKEPHCPSSETLLSFALGRLTRDQADEIIQHVQSCSRCGGIMESLSTFESPLRQDAAQPAETVSRAASADAGANAADHTNAGAPKDAGVDVETDIRPPDPGQTTAGPANGHVLLSALDAGDRVSRYQLTRLHASGGMGRVWLASDPSIGREVALKELLPQQSDEPQIWARFMHEAKVTGQLEHPGIVPVYEVNSDDPDKPFYTMRFVKGQTLHHAAKDFRQERQSRGADPRRLRELVTALIGVSNAIAYAHSRGVLHRDLKGRNIVLGDFGEVIVLDWGLAGSIDGGELEDEHFEGDKTISELPAVSSPGTRQTQAGQILGTPGFMAPEQATGDPSLITSKTDVYGLGAVLYEVLTGGPPIQGNSSREILHKVQHESPTPPRETWPDISRPLEAICLKAMAKSPQQRYATPQAFAADLESWLADEAVTACDDPVLVRIGRWARGHRVLVASAAVLLITAVTALSIGTIAISREQQRTSTARVQAEKNLQQARDAVDSMLTRVGHERLRNIPQMESLRRELLEEAVRFHRRFLQDSGNAALQVDAAQAQQRLGDIYRLLGQMEEAVTVMKESEQTLAVVAKTRPSHRVSFLLAECLSKQARFQLDLGDNRAARELAARAVDTFPAGQSPLETVAISQAWQLLADAQDLQGDSAAARTSLQQAITQYERSLYRDDQRCQLGESVARERLAAFLFATDQHAEASQQFRLAVAKQSELSAGDPGDPDITEALARSYRGYASVLKTTDERTESLKTLQQSLAIHRQLVRSYPQVIDYRRALADCLTQLAAVQSVLGDSAGAEITFLDARAEAVSLAEEYPSMLELQTSATASAEALGAFYASERRDEDSERVMAEAAQRLRKLSSRYTDSRDYKAELGRVLRAYSDVAGRNEKFDIALELADEYVQLLEEIATTDDARADDRNELGRGYQLLSGHHQELDDLPAAMQWLRRAIDVQRKLVADQPNIGDYQRQLAGSLSRLAGIHLRQSEFRDAHRLHDEGLKIRQQLHAAEPDWTQVHLDLSWAHRFRARILTAERRWEQAGTELDQSLILLNELRSKRGVSDLYNQAGLHWLERTQLLLAQEKLTDALETIERGIAEYRAELADNPQRLHATRGLYRFSRRKADIWIRLGNYAEAVKLIRTAESLTLEEEWGNPFEVALLISRVLPLLDETPEFDPSQRDSERQQLAELAVTNLRRALQFDCPPEEILSVKQELMNLSFHDGFQELLTELTAM